jgi:hypothetical protein
MKQRSYGPLSYPAIGRDVLHALDNDEVNLRGAQGRTSQHGCGKVVSGASSLSQHCPHNGLHRTCSARRLHFIS